MRLVGYRRRFCRVIDFIPTAKKLFFTLRKSTWLRVGSLCLAVLPA